MIDYFPKKSYNSVDVVQERVLIEFHFKFIKSNRS